MSLGHAPPFGGQAGPERSSPAWQPTPNSRPEGSITGTPVRTVLRSMPLLPGVSVMIAPGTRENRVLVVTPPNVAFTVFVGDPGVTPQTGYACAGGAETEIPLVGFQEVHAVSNAPVTLRLQIKITSILAAETERRL